MILYPAIDVKGGQCVRLYQGEMSRATIFNDDPAAQARRFVAAGCRFLHIVDLDGAFAGRSMNAAAVAAIVEAVGVPVQLGGGIRDRAAIEAWLGRGVARVILGTLAQSEPAFVREACRDFPGRILVGIDARRGRVAVEGWTKEAARDALDLAQEFEGAGAAAIVYTDIERDGAMTGVNVAQTAALARAISTPVIASGGVASLADLVALKAHEADGISGVICGRALYDGRIDLRQALAVLETAPSC